MRRRPYALSAVSFFGAMVILACTADAPTATRIREGTLDATFELTNTSCLVDPLSHADWKNLNPLTAIGYVGQERKFEQTMPWDFVYGEISAWRLSNPGVASFTTFGSSGRYREAWVRLNAPGTTQVILLYDWESVPLERADHYCSPLTVVADNPTTVLLDPIVSQLAVGESTQLFAMPVGPHGNMPGRSISWSTSNPGVLAVSSGRITGMGTGTASVTASYLGASRSLSVTVSGGATPPSGEISGPSAHVPGQNCTWFANASGVAPPFNYQWFDGNPSYGAATIGYGSMLTYTSPLSSGTYQIFLRITDSRGVQSTVSKDVAIVGDQWCAS
jgi:hypothetical protein